MKKYVLGILVTSALVTAVVSHAQQQVQGPLPPTKDGSPIKDGQGGIPKGPSPKTPPQVPIPATVKWNHGSAIQLCTAETAKEPSKCVKRALPKALGKVSAVVPGAFVNGETSAASWITQTDKGYSLCYYAQDDKHTVECRPLLHAPIITGATFNSKNVYGMDVLTVTLPPDAPGVAGSDPTQSRAALRAFAKGFGMAKKAANKSSAMRLAGTMPTPKMSLAKGVFADGSGAYLISNGSGNGGCGGDDERGSTCDVPSGDGGGGYPPEGGGGYPGDDGNDSPDDGGYNWPSGDEPSPGHAGDGEMPPDGGDVIIYDTNSNSSPPVLPPGTTVNADGSVTTCVITPVGMVCTTVGKRPDPVDMPLPVPNFPIPPSVPVDDPSWWCSIPIIGHWLCTGEDPVVPGNGTGLPPHPGDQEWVPEPTWPVPAEPHAPPKARFRHGYEEAREQCEQTRSEDEQFCSTGYMLRGGPLYREKQERGEKLTSEERAWLKEANNFYGSCMRKAATAWENCLRQAIDDYREGRFDDHNPEPLKTQDKSR